MKPGSAVLAGAAVLVCAGLAILLFKVDAGPSAGVSDSEIDSARQRYARSQASRTPRPRSEPIERPTPRDRPKKPPREEIEEVEEVAEVEEVPPRPMPRPEADPPVPTDREMTFPEKVMQVRKAYDSFDMPGALDLAKDALRDQPDHVYLLRVMVSAGCALGDESLAREYFGQLDAKGRGGLSARCKRYGVTLED